MAKYFIEPNIHARRNYGIDIYEVWENSAHWNADLGVYTLKYETSSKAKAEAVREYLAAKNEQDDMDQYRSADIRGTIVPSAINFPGRAR